MVTDLRYYVCRNQLRILLRILPKISSGKKEVGTYEGTYEPLKEVSILFQLQMCVHNKFPYTARQVSVQVTIWVPSCKTQLHLMGSHMEPMQFCIQVPPQKPIQVRRRVSTYSCIGTQLRYLFISTVQIDSKDIQAEFSD